MNAASTPQSVLDETPAIEPEESTEDAKTPAQLTAEEIAALSPEDRQVRALEIERDGLVKRDLKDRVKQVDDQLKFWKGKAKKAAESKK